MMMSGYRFAKNRNKRLHQVLHSASFIHSVCAKWLPRNYAQVRRSLKRTQHQQCFKLTIHPNRIRTWMQTNTAFLIALVTRYAQQPPTSLGFEPLSALFSCLNDLEKTINSNVFHKFSSSFLIKLVNILLNSINSQVANLFVQSNSCFFDMYLAPFPFHIKFMNNLLY